MGKYKKILVAFDGSGSSENALRQAIKLARDEQSWIKVVAVVPSYEGDLELVGVSNIEEVLKGPAEKLVRAAEEIAASESASVITNIEQGEAYERIVEVADEESCDLIVMGRKGKSRLEKILVGSVTARVINHSSRDVLVVPAEKSVDWSRIMLATDGSSYSRAALGNALDYAASRGGALTAVSVVDVYPEFYAEAPKLVEQLENKALSVINEVKQAAGAAGVEVETASPHGNAAEEIVDLAKEKRAGVIFIGHRGLSGIKKLVMGSVTEKVIGLSECPVFVIRTET